MNEEADTSANVREAHEVRGRDKLIKKIKELQDESQIRRITIYKENGETLLDMEFRQSLTMTLFVTLVLPKVLALVLIAPLLAGYKIQVIRRKPQIKNEEREKEPHTSIGS